MATDEIKGTTIEAVKLDRPITLIGGISLVIGGVIGMGIYALIAAVGANAGSSLWLAFSIAIAVSIIGVAPLVQIASAMPRAGGGYLYTSRLLNPLLGTITSYWAILGGACSTVVVALGLAGYIVPYLPFDVPVQVIALILPLLFFVLYFFGLKLATIIQVVFAIHLIIALLIYGFAGGAEVELHFALEFPQGMEGFIMACILSYSVCMGFQVIAEMGEEMVHASRNIPLSLIIGGVIILVIYILVGTVFISSIPYDFESIKNMEAPLKETGEQFLPGYLVLFLSLGAVSAGLTSFNAGAIAIPRELFSQARDGVAPKLVGKIHKRTKSPLNAVAAYFIFVILLTLLNQSIDFYGVMTAVGILLMTAVIAIAAVRLPYKFPDRYNSAYFKLSKVSLFIIAILAVLSCIGFTAIVLMELPIVGVVYIGWTALVIIYYLIRVQWLKKKGVDWEARIKQIPGFDE